MNKLENINNILVIGCPRSGTSFLMKCLRALPYSDCLIGKRFPVPIVHLVGSYSVSTEIINCISYAFRCSLQEYLDSESGSRFMSLREWLIGCMSISELIQNFQRRRQLERLIYKETFLSFVPEFAFYALPNCKIIYIYRDGRDCANSLVTSYDILSDEKLTNLYTSEMPLGRKYDRCYIPWWVEIGQEEEFLECTPYSRAIWMWKEMVHRCYRFFSNPEISNSDRVMWLRYEDLVNCPIDWGFRIVNFLEENMNEELRKRFSQANSGSIGKYKWRDREEIEAAEKIAKAELKLYGYL